jgi:3-dehydrosphinganine reductase
MKPAFWKNRHVALTGGTSGIGLATTELLLGLGARVSVIALGDQAAKTMAQRTGQRLRVVEADVRHVDQVNAAFATAREGFGPISSLITCAGIVKPGYFHEFTDDDLRGQLEVNYFGTLWAIRAALPDFMAPESMGPDARATITCISSAAGLVGVFGYGAYTPSKFAVRGLCEVLRQEYKPYGISVTTVYPPDVDTPMLAAEQPLKPAELRALSDGEKPMSARQVAQALIEGTERGAAGVTPGAMTKALAVASGTAPRLLARYMDAVIAKARKRAIR